MKISVVTVAYKSADILLRSIQSLFKFNDLGDELEYILVDNSPLNERVDKKLPLEILNKIKYIPANNKGFGAGNNIGARSASGEILAFINPDIIFVEPIFNKIYKKFNSDKKILLMGGKLLYEDLTSGFSFYFDYKYSVIKKWSLKLWNKINYFDSENMYISGADMFIKRDLFLKSGMFDENIFMYYEEPDLTRRIKQNADGYVLFDKNIHLIHLERKSTPNSLNSIKYEFESAIYYGKKYNLNYVKKINFEYKYYKLKKIVYMFVKKKKYDSIRNICEFLEEKYKTGDI